VYCTIRLQFPEDTLMKKCISFITENIQTFDAKATSLSLWALAKMHYPSAYIQTLMLKKVQKQVDLCLANEKLFTKVDIKEEPEFEGQVEPDLDQTQQGLETGQTIALYYWGLSKLGVGPAHNVYRELDKLVARHYAAFTI
jgi:hypothetical protein